MSIRRKIADYIAYQRTVRELSKLDPRLLSDIGISQDDIKTAARSQFI